MYLLVWSPTGIQGWDWMWIALGVLLDLMKWTQIANNRKGIPGYPQGAPPPTTPSVPPPPPRRHPEQSGAASALDS